ncbi:9870_t:CDS:2 [Entrophospora sp. SA101]|nr:9870_t:CDS:2 [Entrophospora sp. SA101]
MDIGVYLASNYLKKGDRKNVEQLNLANLKLTGELDFTGLGFDNLKRLDISNNNLTKLTLLNPQQITYLDISNNKLSELNIDGLDNLTFGQIKKNPPEIMKLVDISDLDDFINNYDFEMEGDADYHSIIGGGLTSLDEYAVEQLSQTALARALIKQNELVEGQKNEQYEKVINNYARSFQKSNSMYIQYELTLIQREVLRKIAGEEDPAATFQKKLLELEEVFKPIRASIDAGQKPSLPSVDKIKEKITELQDITQKQKEDISQLLNSLKKTETQRRNLEEKNRLFKESLETVFADSKEYEQKNEELTKRLTTYATNEQQYQDKIKELETEIKDLVDNHGSEIKKLKEEITKLLTDKNEYISQLEQTIKQLRTKSETKSMETQTEEEEKKPPTTNYRKWGLIGLAILAVAGLGLLTLFEILTMHQPILADILKFIIDKKEDFTQLKKEKTHLEAKLQDYQNTIDNNRQQLDQLKNELTKSQQARESLEIKIKELSKNQLSAAEIAQIREFSEELQQIQTIDFNEHIGDVINNFGDIFKVIAKNTEEVVLIIKELKAKEQELTTLRQQSTASTAKLRQEITDLKNQLQKNQTDLQSSQQERDQLTTQIQQLTTKNQELETQLTALAVSSGLLAQQCEDLTKKLSESERKEAQTKLENEIKANLLQQKDQELKNKETTITEQQEKIKNYQQILRTKKIKDLETNFLASQTKIMELEARIQELEKDNSKDTEIIRLKQQLTTEKQKSQQKEGLDKWDTYLNFLETKNADLENLFVYADFASTISQEEQAKYIKVIEDWVELQEQRENTPSPSNSFIYSQLYHKDQQIEQLKIELQTEKDKVAGLETEYQELMKQLDNIKTELALTPSTPQPEKQTLKDRISYFNNFIKKNRQESQDLRENIKKEQKKSQEIRSSLISLENQLKNQENKSEEVNKLTQENEKLKQQLSNLTNNLSQQEANVNKLTKENENLQTKIATDQLLNEEKNKQSEPIPYGTYFF